MASELAVPPPPQPLTDVEVVRMAPVNNAALKAEDARNFARGVVPRRFALPIRVKITPDTHGDWEALEAVARGWCGNDESD